MELQPNTTKECYFAAVNSADGFQSYFDTVFADARRLYIIKGGSGTGKSHLMRTVAQEAEKEGYTVEYYYCSSDVHSLDGILIREMGIGILDGTAPHTTDPVYPGIRDEIVNVGDFWDTSALSSKKQVISSLIDQKKRLYEQVYRNLFCARVLEEEMRHWILPYIQEEKMARAASRLCAEGKRGEGFSQTLRLCEAISTDGPFAFDSLERGRRLFWIQDRFEIADLFLRQVRLCAKEKAQSILYSIRPLTKTQLRTVVIPSANLCFSSVEDNLLPQRAVKEKIINMDRFVQTKALSPYRTRIRFCKKGRDACLQEAYTVLEQIKFLHAKLEEHYIACMDFQKKEAYTKTLLAKMFG